MPIRRLAFLIKGTTSERFAVRDALRILTPAWGCLLAALALSLLGVYAIDLAERADPADPISHAATKQLFFIALGAGACLSLAVIHYRFAAYIATPAMLLTIALLVFLLLPFVPTSIVSRRNGARAWIDLGVFLVQPAELAKIAVVLAVARFLRYRSQHRRLLGLVPPALITAVPVALIILQPDLGSASLFIPALFAMLLAAGARIRHLALIVAVALIIGPATYPVLRPHQQERIVALIRQIEGDRTTARDINFQSFTAQDIAAAGGVTGSPDPRTRSLVHYNRLPEAHNDMIFAVITNRFGLAGALATLALILTWVLCALATSAMTRDPFARLICVGLAAFIATQALVNIAMNIGLMPIIGITLPFVSYGGSSIIASWLMTSLVLAVGTHRALPPYRNSFEFDP